MIVSSTGGPYENTDGVDWRYVLPPYDSSDAGKVLTIHDYSGQTEVAWEEIIPITYSHELYDRVLTIPAGSGGPQWRSIFPYYDSSDAGKVLSVNNDGELEWINP